tara:strand:+ start:1419 stop:1736 length:318 start_codon:yes stop_codon:yes gene_type:complete
MDKMREDIKRDWLSERVNEIFEELLDDDYLLWEAAGPDGVDQNFFAPKGAASNVADLARADEIRVAILAEDDAELGRIMRDQVVGYLTRIATDDAENEYDEGDRS